MKNQNHYIMRILSLSLLLSICILSLSAQDKKALTLEDYKDWSRITNTAISPDGEWMTYAYSPNEGDTAKFFIRELEGDEIYSGWNAKTIRFSNDSKWLGFLVSPTKSEMEALKKKKKPVTSALHLYNLNNQTVDTIKAVQGYRFSEVSNYLAIKKAKSNSDAEHTGTDLIIRNLNDGTTLNIGNVSEYDFNEKGSLIAYLVDADGDSGNGVYIRDLETQGTWPLHSGRATYSQLSWNEEGDQLAALFGITPEGKVQRENTLLWASGLQAGMNALGAAQTYVPNKADDFPEAYLISEYYAPKWNEAGTQLFLGIKAQQDVLKEKEELEANVDVWHWKDEVVQSRQMKTANQDRKSTYLSVLNLSNQRFVQLETEDRPDVESNEKSAWAVASVDTAYRTKRNMPSGYADLYRIDTRNGATALIAEKVYHDLGIAPMGDYAVYSREGMMMLYHFEKGETTNITKRLDVSFQNKDFDRPVEKPTYGIGAWSSDGKWVMLNNKYDIYAFSLQSDKVLNLTKGLGKKENIRFRLMQLDPEAETLDVEQPLLLSAYGEWTKKSGYYGVSWGKQPKALRYLDKMLGRPAKAKDADVIMYTEQTFEEFSDYWVTDLSFKSPQKVTNANPQITDFKWGRRVLVDYTDQRGHKLQATLALPAGYEKGKKYPMIIYFYEKMSQRHHQFSMPTYDDRPHMSTYASNGYLVLMPDIIYDEGKPGSSALDDITSAAQEVIDLGYADPKRIGLQGHSWGGYESSFILTQTDMFACTVTGAPLTNLISMYNVAYKRTGNLNGPILEWSQGRMGVSPWDNMELYRSQSPIHHAQNISTPFLILHGTADGAVDWVQGLEYYATARRLGKEVILLSYPDEPHHLQKEANQKDFQIRMKQYFDYYLKDVTPPVWIKEGVKHLDKKRVKPTDK
ncbi:MAG: prolyl oligopeptidase family serine peptidase [Saprospiraceae bacterium]